MNDFHDMDKELIEEIKYYAGKLPPQRQERILEVIRATLFSKKGNFRAEGEKRVSAGRGR